MRSPILEQQEEGENNNVTEFKLLQGGKEPPSTSSNWLSDLEVGMVFLVQDQQPIRPINSFALGEFRLMKKTDKTCWLATITETGIQTIPVNPVRFCNKYSKWEELGVIVSQEQIDEKETEAKEGEDG